MALQWDDTMKRLISAHAQDFVASLLIQRRRYQMNEELKHKLAALLHQAAEDHHVAYKETMGVDPDWSIWYSGYLLEKGFDKLLDAKILKSDLIYLLVLVDKKQTSEAPGAHWENYYANFFINRYLQ